MKSRKLGYVRTGKMVELIYPTVSYSHFQLNEIWTLTVSGYVIKVCAPQGFVNGETVNISSVIALICGTYITFPKCYKLKWSFFDPLYCQIHPRYMNSVEMNMY